MTRADKRTHHYIYKITRFDGKFYIGMHSTNDLEDGYFGSGKLITRSIKKHGKENHLKEILEYLPTRKALKLREKEIVNEELLGDKKCMNLKLGGEGGWDHVKNQHIAGKAGGIATAKRLREDKHFAKEWSKRATRINLVAYENGRRVAGAFSENRLEMVERARSERSCEKRKSTYASIKHQQGLNNSQFGTCWVTNGEAIKIKKQDLEVYLANGYIRGRKHAREVLHGGTTPS